MTTRTRRFHRRERGSTILYAVILSGVAAVLAVANLQVASGVRRLQARREETQRWEYVRAAAAAQLDQNIRDLPGYEPGGYTLNLGGEAYKVEVSTTGKPKIYSLDLTSNRYGAAQTYAYDPRGKHPFLYGLYVDKAANINNDLILGSNSESTHAYFGGPLNITSAATQTVYGALERKEAAAPAFDNPGLVTTGTARPAAATPSGALVNNIGANAVYVSDRTFGTGAYSGVGSVYVISTSGKVTVTGTIRGRVTILTTDKIVIQPPLVMANANSKLVLVSKNDMMVDGGGVVEAFAYCEKKIEVKKGEVNWRGAIVCDSIDATSELKLILDPFFYDAAELDRFRVPQNGYGLD